MLRIPILALASLVALLSTACGGSPGEDIGQGDQDLSIHQVKRIATISYAPNSFVIGNVYPGWHMAVQGPAQFSSGPGNTHGASYRWGYIWGEGFDRCAWIDDSDATGSGAIPGSYCGAPQEIDTAHFMATYTNGIHNDLAGDGSPTRMHYSGSGCTDRDGYGNVDPWKVPASPRNSLGAIPDGTLLRWRYVTRDGRWVLVRQPGASSGTAPNWFFVHRGCVSVANTGA